MSIDRVVHQTYATIAQVATRHGTLTVPLGPCPFGGVHGLTVLEVDDRVFACCPKCQQELVPEAVIGANA